jgi:hypothetical protein
MGPLSLVLSATVGFLAAAPVPQFAPSYSQALAQSHREHKPVAIFLGTGANGLSKLVADGGLTGTTGSQLKSDFVCLYVDTTSAAGQKLAGDFGMTEGLVISDRDGAKQALRHAGTVTPATLATYATAYAGTAVAQATTIDPVTVAAPVLAAPAYTPAPSYYSAPQYAFPMRGGCASGRCPNAR